MTQNNACTFTPELDTNNNPDTTGTVQTHTIPFMDEEIDKGSISYMTTEIETPYQIDLSTDPLDNHINIEITTMGNHGILGLDLKLNILMGQIVRRQHQ